VQNDLSLIIGETVNGSRRYLFLRAADTAPLPSAEYVEICTSPPVVFTKVKSICNGGIQLLKKFIIQKIDIIGIYNMVLIYANIT